MSFDATLDVVDAIYQSGFAEFVILFTRSTGGAVRALERLDDVGELFDESTRSDAVNGACEFTQQMLPTLAKAVVHEEMMPELAEVLSTNVVVVEYEVETDVSVR